MILSRRVALKGEQLDEIDEAIVIRSVDTGMSRNTAQSVNRMGGFGQRITGDHWETLDVNVAFAINVPKRELARRKEIFDRVITWANRQGRLTVNYMEGRHLWVDRTEFPSPGDLWDWTGEYTLTFRAYNVPFWEDVAATEVRAELVSGNNITRQIEVPGNVGTTLDVIVRNRSGVAIPTFTVSAGKSEIGFSNLNLGGSETLQITHGTDGLLRAKVGSRDVYGTMTGSDDLYVDPGTVTVRAKVPRAVDLTVRTWGRWIG